METWQFVSYSPVIYLWKPWPIEIDALPIKTVELLEGIYHWVSLTHGSPGHKWWTDGSTTLLKYDLDLDMFAVSFTAWLLPNHIPCCIISKYIARSKYLLYIYDIYIICVNIYIICVIPGPHYIIYISPSYPHHIPIIVGEAILRGIQHLPISGYQNRHRETAFLRAIVTA